MNLKSDINKIVLAALNALSPEKAILYTRKVIKEDNAALIADGSFEIEVRNILSDIYILNIINHFALITRFYFRMNL